MKIGILTAMTKEHDRIAELLDAVQTLHDRFTYVTGQLNGHEIVLRQCGIGKVNAAVGTAELIRTFSPDCVVSTGVAGGIDTRLQVMDVVVSDRLVQHDFDLHIGYERGDIQGTGRFFTADTRLVDAARRLHDPTIHVGLICTGDQFVTQPTELSTVKSFFPDALAVDMESAAIAQTCQLYGIPFVSFRIISDIPGADHHMQQYEDFWTDMALKSFTVTRRFLSHIDGNALAPQSPLLQEGQREAFIFSPSGEGNREGVSSLWTIPSFTVNHEKLKRGVYVSRKDRVDTQVVTTFDVRMKEPNREPALSPSAIHTIEHLAATFLRHHPQWQDRIIYWGPMGCLTGNYLLVRGDYTSADILPLLRETFQFIATFRGHVPGASPRDCGNYLLMNLPMARWEARKYLDEVLLCITDDSLVYPD